MAELLGVIASGISVVQIAGQLVGCIQQLHIFCRSMRDLPNDLQHILQELHILSELFCQLEGLNSGDVNTASAGLLHISLLNCQAAAASLEGLALKTNRSIGGQGKRKQLPLLRATLGKAELKELNERLDTAKSLLHLAMTCHQVTMQQQHLAIIRQGRLTNFCPEPWPKGNVQAMIHPAPSELGRLNSFNADHRSMNVSEKSILRISTPVQPNSVLLSKCAIRKCYCACHYSISQSGRFWSLRLSSSLRRPCNKASCSNYKRASLWINLLHIGIPYAIIANLDVMWNSQNTFIAPSLQMKRVVSWNSPAFRTLRDIRWLQIDWTEARERLVDLFGTGQASPLDILPDGMTLVENILTLPWPNGDLQLKLLEMLVNMGAQLNTTGWNGLGRWKTGSNDSSPAHNSLINKLLSLGLELSEADALSRSDWPSECSPKLRGYQDPFFVHWITSLIKVEPGFAGLNPFLEAILIDSESEVKARLNKFSVLDNDNLLRQSALHFAVSRPQHIQFLLDVGADPNARDWNGRTPLMYAAATGSIDVTISLLRGGADPWSKDSLYAREDFIEYAVRHDYWPLVMAAMDYLRQSRQYSKEQVRSLLNVAIVLWAGEESEKKNSQNFNKLLEWGADPEVRFTERWKDRQRETQNTLLHCIDTLTDFDSLIASGFKGFNHANSVGAHALMKITSSGDSQLLWKCINGGSLVDHQDYGGGTALHTSLEELWDSFMQTEQDQCQHQSGAMDCARVLLQANADPFLGDFCQCACSKSGCTPVHILLKNHRYFRDYRKSYPFSQYVWTLEWLHTLNTAKGFESAKQCALDMLRLANFEEMGLTHTCCRKYHRKGLWHVLDEDDVLEILDEEKEMIADLDMQMREIEHSLGSDLEKSWLNGLSQLFNAREHFDAMPPTDVGIQKPAHEAITEQFQLDDYVHWMKYEHKRISRDVDFTASWVEKRTTWVPNVRSVLENARAKAVREHSTKIPC